MLVEIWSDIVCPFCYIGKKNFEKALENFSEKNQVTYEMKSFELDPHAKIGTGLTTYQMLSKKYGMGLEEAKQMTHSVVQRGKEVGLNFNFDTSIPTNTFLAHRFLHLAKTKGLQMKLQELLFEGHFMKGLDVGDQETLKQLSCDAGLSENDINMVLNSEMYSAEVRQDEQMAQQMGLRGVPAFLINGKYLVSGAQPTSVFAEALAKAYSEKV